MSSKTYYFYTEDREYIFRFIELNEFVDFVFAMGAIRVKHTCEYFSRIPCEVDQAHLDLSRFEGEG